MRNIYPFLLLCLFFPSCNSFIEGYDESPNTPTEVRPSLLLSATQLATAAVYSGQLARLAAVLTQHQAGTDFQFIEIATYNILEGDNDNQWTEIYTDLLINAQALIDMTEGESPHYAGMGKVLKAMGLGIATDIWGDIPSREAVKGLEGGQNMNPNYDKQELVIEDIQTLLSDAIADFSISPSLNKNKPDSDDLIHKGELAKWRKMAFMLKARYANRLSKKDAISSANEALAYLSAAALNSGADDALMPFGENANEQNPWAAFLSDRGGYMKSGAFFVELLKSKNDPRLAAYVAPDFAGNYTGTELSSQSTVTSDAGPFCAAAAAPVPLVTFMEAKFIEAEANFRLGKLPEAAAAHNTAVKASILFVNDISDPVYEANEANEDWSSISLEKIMTQKYLALFTQIESWSDWRRTALPQLVPEPNSVLGNAAIPRRLPTPFNERVSNTNVQVVSDILEPVWWDQ